jgi:hypothetical protein
MRRGAVAALAVITTFALPATADAQGDPPPPPCPAGVPANVTISASDLEDNGGPLTATHTIHLDVQADDRDVGDFKLDLPPGAERRRGGPTPAFSIDAPGPVLVRVTWPEFNNGSECTASAETTVNVEPAKPLRYRGPARSSRFMNALHWSLSFGDNADLRPLEMRLRGVRRARLPGGSAPLQTVTFAFRRGDRGLSYDGRSIRVLRSAGWRFQTTFGHSRRDISIDMLNYPGPGKGFGIDLELVQAGRVIGRTRARGRCSYLVCRYRSARGPTAAQATDPSCPPGEAPSATIRGFDVEDGGGQLTATHTIGLEVRDRDGVIPRASFTVPANAQNRGDEDNPAFSIDTPGPVPVTATWSHEIQSDGSTCTATTQGTLRLRPAGDLTFLGLPRGPSFADAYSLGLRTGRNADLRPVQFRLRGVKRARLPGPGARLQKATIVLRRGDPGLSRGESRTLRAGGWRFRIGNADEHIVIFNAEVIENRRGRRGPSRGFGYTIVLVQAGHRVGRVRVTGRCGYLGCRWRAL